MTDGSKPRGLKLKKKTCPQCGVELPRNNTKECDACGYGKNDTLVHPAHAKQMTTETASNEDNQRKVLSSALGGEKEDEKAEYIHVPFGSILKAPFHPMTFLETLYIWIPFFLLLLPFLIMPMKSFGFVAQNQQTINFLFKYVIFGILSLYIIARLCGLSAAFSNETGVRKEPVSAGAIFGVFIMLLVLTDVPVRMAIQQIGPETLSGMAMRLMSLQSSVTTGGGAGWLTSMIAFNKQSAMLLWNILTVLPWFLDVALVWYILYRPIAIAMAGIYEEWDPTEVIQGLFKIFFQYIFILLISNIFSLIVLEIIMGISFAVIPHITMVSTNPNVAIRIMIGIGSIFLYLCCYMTALEYAMLGVTLKKYQEKLS